MKNYLPSHFVRFKREIFSIVRCENEYSIELYSALRYDVPTFVFKHRAEKELTA